MQVNQDSRKRKSHGCIPYLITTHTDQGSYGKKDQLARLAQGSKEVVKEKKKQGSSRTTPQNRRKKKPGTTSTRMSQSKERKRSRPAPSTPIIADLSSSTMGNK